MVTGCSVSPHSSTNGSSSAKVKYCTCRRGLILSKALGAGPAARPAPGRAAARAARRTGSMVRAAGPVCCSAAALRDTLAHRRPQCLVQVFDDVVHVLDADGQPDEIRGDARGPRLLFGQLLVRRAGRVNDQRLGVAQVGQQREQLDAVDEAAAGLVAAFDAEGEDGAGAFGQILAGQLVRRVAGQAGVADPRYPDGKSE